MGGKLAHWAIQWRWWLLLAIIGAVFAMSSGVVRTTMDTDYRVFFDGDNPQLMAFNQIQTTYSKNDNVLFVVAPKSGAVFSKNTLSAIMWLTRESEQIPRSSRVDSITNYQHTRADGDDLLVEYFVEHPEQLTDVQLHQLQQIATNEPLLVHRLISPQADVTAVNVTIQLPDEDKQAAVPLVVDKARDIATRFQQQFPEHDIYLTGLVMFNNAFVEASQEDVKNLFFPMFIMIVVFMGLLLRSISASIVTLVIIVCSVIPVYGMMAWLGFPLSGPTTLSPALMIMTLAIADCIHLLNSFLHSMRNGMSKANAIAESLRINFSPVIITSVTTAVGFLSMNFSDAPPFRHLGNMVACGVLLACLFALLLLPCLLMLLPVRQRKPSHNGHYYMDRFADFIVARHKFLFVLSSVVSLSLVALVPQNRLDDQFVEYFDHSIDFRTATDFTVAHLTGINTMEYSISAGEPYGINEPAYMHKLADFTEWLRQQQGVMHVNSITDTVKRLNKNMHWDEQQWYRLPDNRELTAQLLFIFRSNLPRGLDLNDQINVDESSVRLVVTLENLSSERILALEQDAAVWMQSNFPDSMQSVAGSPSIMFAHIGQRNIISMLEGSLIAVVVISALLIFALRDLKLGLISLLPNLVPIGVAFGCWYLIDGRVGMALSVVASMTLGIIVDDTVHFLSKYLRAQREEGLDAVDAVRYAFHTVGGALLVTTIVLVTGFMLLAQSAFAANADTGLVTAIAIAIALIFDFIFLPSLLILIGKRNHA